jgi:hypothetical protein
MYCECRPTGRGSRNRRSPHATWASPVPPQLIDPRGELVAIESQILTEFHVRDAVRARALVEPAHGHSQQLRSFLDRQPGHQDRSWGLSDRHAPPEVITVLSERAGTSANRARTEHSARTLPSARPRRGGSVTGPQGQVSLGEGRLSSPEGLGQRVGASMPRLPQPAARPLHSATVYESLIDLSGTWVAGNRPDHGCRSPAAPASRLLARVTSSQSLRGDGADGDAGIGVGAAATDHGLDGVHPR